MIMRNPLHSTYITLKVKPFGAVGILAQSPLPRSLGSPATGARNSASNWPGRVHTATLEGSPEDNRMRHYMLKNNNLPTSPQARTPSHETEPKIAQAEELGHRKTLSNICDDLRSSYEWLS